MDPTDYFSDRRMVRVLCRKRIAQARYRRRERFVSGLVGDEANVGIHRDGRDELVGLLPPRRHWYHFRPDRDARSGARVPAPDLLLKRMTLHVICELEQPSPRYRWVERLSRFLVATRSRALSWSRGEKYSVKRIAVLPKDKPGNGRKYRVLAEYDLSNVLIANGYAAYLRDLVEPLASRNSFAFRGTWDDLGRPPTHHDAFERVLEYRSRFGSVRDLWAAEVDIQGFYDAVSHDVIWVQVRKQLANAGDDADGRLLDFIESFLRGYSYEDLAVPKAREVLAASGIEGAILAEPRVAMRGCGIAPAEDRIGVPQGSFISCVLANVILAPADDVVEAALASWLPRPAWLYLRYCDDMLAVAPNRNVLNEALDHYLKMLGRLRLPFHAPIEVEKYGRGFWSKKSKRPYRWSSQGGLADVPWLSFVGYQTRRDGVVRVRRNSVNKELEKQGAVAEEYVERLREVERQARAAKTVLEVPPLREVLYRIRMHLLAIGVGYPREHELEPAPISVSWCGGFGVVDGEPHDDEPLRRLDAGRRRAINTVRYEYEKALKRGWVRSKKPGPVTKKRSFRIRYDGRPFSYWGQFGEASAWAGAVDCDDGFMSDLDDLSTVCWPPDLVVSSEE